jgi:hypothetical protein
MVGSSEGTEGQLKTFHIAGWTVLLIYTCLLGLLDRYERLCRDERRVREMVYAQTGTDLCGGASVAQRSACRDRGDCSTVAMTISRTGHGRYVAGTKRNNSQRFFGWHS